MRRSAATAICSPIWCGGCWRTAPTPRSSSVAADPTVPVADILKRPQALDRRRRRTRAIRTFRCRAISTGRRGSNSAGVEFGDRAALDALLARSRSDARARRRRSTASRAGARAMPVADRRRAIGRGAKRCPRAVERCDAGRARAPDGAATRAAELLEASPRHADRAAAVRRRQDARRRAGRGARGGRLLPLLRRARRAARSRRSRCRARPARATSCAIAAAACSSASARGIFRWRSSSARSRRRSPPAMPWWPSPPSRRR